MYTGYRTEEISFYWYVADFQGRAEDLDDTTDTLSYTVYYAETGWVEIVASTAVDLTTDRDSLGRYKITWTPAVDADVGLYYISWTENRDGTIRVVRKMFEVIESFDPNLTEWNKYRLAMVRDIREMGIDSSTKSDRLVILALIKAAQYMERSCGRRFGSRYTTMKIDPARQVKDDALRLPEYCAWLQDFGAPDQPDLDITLTKFYSRAIRGELGTPSYGQDDRDNPKFEGYDYMRSRVIIFNTEDFIRITGLWGYVDPDGSDSGKVPEEIRAAVLKVTQMYLASVMGDGDTEGEGYVGDRVIKEKTATQTYELNRLDEGGLMFSKFVLRGDSELAKTIIRFRRPIQGGRIKK